MRRACAKTIGCAALLFALNACITPRLFVTDYTHQMGSIEAAFIGLARYASEHWNDMGWFPLWYGGIAYPDSYPPLLHWVVGLMITLSGVSPGLAYHFVVAMVYSLGPVTLFWMAWRLCGSRECALFAGIGYSLISPSCFLAQSVRGSSDGFLGAHRLITLVVWGEGPHLTSMCLLALAIGMLHVAFEKRKPWYWVAAALSVAAVPMSNWLGAMALAIGMLAYLFAGFSGGQKTLPTLLRAGAVAVFAYALVVPWLSPATIAVIRANAPRVANYFQSDATQHIFVAAVAAVFLAAAWAMARWKLARHTRFAVLASLVTGTTALGSFWFKLSLLPQPDRYHLEMDMFLWVAAVFAVWPLASWLFRRLPRRLPGPLGLRPALVVAVVLAIACLPIVKKQRRTARWEERPIDIQATIEYKTAKWLDAHMAGARVFAPGTIGFWLNAFSDAPQITGGFDNGIRNPFVPGIIFYVYAGDNQQYTVDLLKAYGCDAMIGGGKDSAEVYHPISHVEKLRGLTELWRDGGDAVYDIPRRSRSLAHVMRPGDLMMRPLALYGFSALDPYLAALENPDYPRAEFRWRAPSAASITADLKPDQVLSVQIAWDQGWNVTVGGRRVPAWSDKLGQMVVAPRCSGPCTVELIYDGGTEGMVARAVHRTALAGGGLWILVAILWRKRSGLTKTN
ncbi:MAG: hypothetical protein NTW28_25650 [Candidatus Solibacter sp.]|nr:hypothetical protein [Candidatus Solibacter sp.]